jgi:phosphodiesterase/alkaline phosphatase D-like protein
MATLNPLMLYNSPEGPLFAPDEGNANSQALYLGTATTAEEMTLNTDCHLVRIQADQDIWYLLNATVGDATAVAPTTEDITGASILLPAGQERYVNVRGFGGISCVSAVNSTAVNVLEWK